MSQVIFCATDVLELVMQQISQGADAMCAADCAFWASFRTVRACELRGRASSALSAKLTRADNELHGPTAFYDNWVARTIKGEAFIPVRGWDWVRCARLIALTG